MSGFVSLNAFIIQFVILLLIIWVLRKFIFIPYLQYLDSWEEKQKKLEDEYRNIDSLVTQAKQEGEEILSDARKKSESILLEAESIAKSKRQSIIEKAEQEALDIIQSGKQSIEKDKLSMLQEVKTNIVDLVVKFNTKLFGEAKVSHDFVEKELEFLK